MEAEVQQYEDIPVPFALFRVVFNDAHDAVTDTEYVYANRLYCQMGHIPWEDMAGRTFREVYPASDSRWFSYCYEAVTKGVTRHDCIFSEETQHWLDFTVGPVSEEDCVSFVFTNVDVQRHDILRGQQTSESILSITKVLNGEEDYETSMNHALQELSRFIHPDRLYVLETDQKTASNTFEWCADGIQPEIGTLQNLDYGDYLGGWERYLEDDTSVVINDIEELKAEDPLDYQNLKRQGIRRLIGAPFYNGGRLIGYLGADNYALNDLINTKLVLETVSYFIGAKVVNQRLIDQMDHLSRYDSLTGVHNRNACMEKIEKLRKLGVSVGIVYADVNGLKRINDAGGHEAGDRALRSVAHLLTSRYGVDNTYRYGGDEFVVLLPMISRSDFERDRRSLLGMVQQRKTHPVALGFEWVRDSRQLHDAVRRADKRMYHDKALYYLQNQEESRAD